MQIEITYVKCPNCGKWYTHSDLLSYSTFGKSECWSDGKCIDNNMSEYSFMPYTQCDACKTFFWFEDCQRINRYEFYSYQNDQESIKPDRLKLIKKFLLKNPNYLSDEQSVSSPTYPGMDYWYNLPKNFIPDFVTLLKDSSLSRKNEIYVRFQLWQHINDLKRLVKHPLARILKFQELSYVFRNFKADLIFFRESKQLYKKYSALRRENLLLLKELLPGSEEEFFIYPEINLIEIERELGNFESSKILLESLSEEVYDLHKTFVRKSKRHISFRSSRVFKI